MKWITQVLLDIAVTAVVVVYAATGATWAWWAVAVYTPLLLLLKLFALAAGSLIGAIGPRAETAPAWFHHLLYGTNVVALLLARSFLLAAAWAAIWALSVAVERRTRGASIKKPARHGGRAASRQEGGRTSRSKKPYR